MVLLSVVQRRVDVPGYRDCSTSIMIDNIAVLRNGFRLERNMCEWMLIMDAQDRDAARVTALHPHKSVRRFMLDLVHRIFGRSTQPHSRNGIPLLPTRKPNTKVCLEAVNVLRDELP
jgi:hypothetical protein